MAVGGVSYIALRALGSRLGLALAGFVGAFISASATIGSMGNRTKRSPELGSAAASAAILATVATVIQMFLVLLVTNVATCRAVAIPLLFAGVAAIGYVLIFVAISSKTRTTNEPAVKLSSCVVLGALLHGLSPLTRSICESLLRAASVHLQTPFHRF
jgi:uncharacterized membrane protein (DUF4010 family)